MEKQKLYTKQLIFCFNLCRKMRLFVLLIFMSHFTIWANENSQQNITVKGLVTETEADLSVTGANILQQGIGNVTMMDFDCILTLSQFIL